MILRQPPDPVKRFLDLATALFDRRHARWGGVNPHDHVIVKGRTGNLGADARFLAPDALRDRLTGAGADAPDAIVSCGSGVNAAHTAVAMRIAGLPAPLLYDGSYSDWSAAGLPVATGDKPGRL